MAEFIIICKFHENLFEFTPNRYSCDAYVAMYSRNNTNTVIVEWNPLSKCVGMKEIQLNSY